MRLPCSLWVGNIYETPTTALCRGAMPGSWSKRHSSTAGVETILTTVITTVEATRSGSTGLLLGNYHDGVTSAIFIQNISGIFIQNISRVRGTEDQATPAPRNTPWRCLTDKSTNEVLHAIHCAYQ
eukprot:COSAG01_NODE_4226_length_5224_cov_15.169171_2_plen_126_part_00